MQDVAMEDDNELFPGQKLPEPETRAAKSSDKAGMAASAANIQDTGAGVAPIVLEVEQKEKFPGQDEAEAQDAKAKALQGELPTVTGELNTLDEPVYITLVGKASFLLIGSSI